MKRLYMLGAFVGMSLLFLVLFIVAGDAAGAATNPPPQFQRMSDTRVVAFTQGMTFLNTMPTSIPSNGVALLGGAVTLRPLTSAQNTQVSISSDQGLSIAQSLVGKLPASQPLLTSFTDVTTLPVPGDAGPAPKTIQDIPSWVVTFTSPTPFSLPGGPFHKNPPKTPVAQSQFFHEIIVIDARTGTFVKGFFM